MKNIQSFSTQNSTQITTQQQINSNSRLFFIIIISVFLTAITTGSVVYFWQKSINEKIVSDLRQEIAALKNQASGTEISEIAPSPTLQQPTSPARTNELRRHFSYKNFSLDYPNDWTLLDMSINEAFPLEERLDALTEKAIALSKNGLYLIITIDSEREGLSEMIFFDDNEYHEFISNADRVNIGNSVFYLAKSHEDISSLLKADTGPWMWSALCEYIPNKMTQSGDVFRACDNLIKRNGYIYQFIITSSEGGATDSQLQKEIISMLETIKW